MSWVLSHSWTWEPTGVFRLTSVLCFWKILSLSPFYIISSTLCFYFLWGLLFSSLVHTQCLLLLPPAQQVLNRTHCSSVPFFSPPVFKVCFVILSLSWFSVFNFQPLADLCLI